MNHIDELRDLLIQLNAEPPVDAADSFLAATYPPACWNRDEHASSPEPGCNLCDSFGRSGCHVHAGSIGSHCPDCPTIGSILLAGIAALRGSR